jgi:hypothetical protein
LIGYTGQSLQGDGQEIFDALELDFMHFGANGSYGDALGQGGASESLAAAILVHLPLLCLICEWEQSLGIILN